MWNSSDLPISIFFAQWFNKCSIFSLDTEQLSCHTTPRCHIHWAWLQCGPKIPWTCQVNWCLLASIIKTVNSMLTMSFLKEFKLQMFYLVLTGTKNFKQNHIVIFPCFYLPTKQPYLFCHLVLYQSKYGWEKHKNLLWICFD